MQKVLDAAVVNPVVDNEYADLMRRSVTAQSGATVTRAPGIAHKADRVAAEKIAVSESDKTILLDPAKLLLAGALVAGTGNPDEAKYLQKAMATPSG